MNPREQRRMARAARLGARNRAFVGFRDARLARLKRCADVFPHGCIDIGAPSAYCTARRDAFIKLLEA